MVRIDKICFGCMNEIENPDQVCPICGYNKRESEKRQKSKCLRPGTIVRENYLVGKVLGVGGFGITYLSKNLKTDQILALKEYFPAEIAYRDIDGPSGKKILVDGSQKRKFYEIGLQNFEKEAKNLLLFQQLDGIVKVENYFRENETAYIAMEYVRGISLKAYLNKREKPLSEKQVLKMIRPVLYALEKIHDMGMIHRDISPENLILDRSGKVTLIDFGAARMATGDETKSLTILLKHGYAPIEQYQSKGRQGAWTDIYALCATLYELLSLRIPKRSMERVGRDDMPSLYELARQDKMMHVSDHISDVIQKGMEVYQENRYQDIASFGMALYQREDWRHYTKTVQIASSAFGKEGYRATLESNKQQFLQEQKRRLAYEKRKEEKAAQQQIERERQIKFQEEYKKQQEYKQKKELEREEERQKKEQEFLKREYERQEAEKKKQQLKLQEERRRKEQEKREEALREERMKKQKPLKQELSGKESSLKKEQVKGKKGELQRKGSKNLKKEVHYRTLESVQSKDADLWYNPYEQEGVDKAVSRKRKIFLAVGFFSLFLCAGIIFMLYRNSEETYVKFGTYPQNEITGSAITKEIEEAEYDERRFATVNGKRYRKSGPYYYVFDDIKWRVLAKENGKVLLISDRILDAIIFSPRNEVISEWKDSFIREWLNDYFYNAAFTEEEKEAIIKSTIETDGEETEDKIFLLSTEDVTDRSLYFTNDSERIAKQTLYAVRRGAQTGDESAGRWWLRTPGTRENTVQVVRANGSLAENSYTVMSNDCGVRPAMWVDARYFDE